MVGMTPKPQIPGERLAFGPRHVGQFLGFAKDLACFLGDFRSQGREADDAAGALDQGDAEQELELAQACRQGRLGDEAAFGRSAEMAVVAQGDQILKLLERRQIDSHWQIRSVSVILAT